MPSPTVDYFFATVSPWAYLGHARFVAMARAAGATVRVKPMDLGEIFPLSGGLPLAKRAPQRQAYRLVELQRFSSHLGIPLHPQPAHFPVNGNPAALLILAADATLGSAAALDLAGRVGAAIWAEQRNVADPAVLAALVAEAGLPASLLDPAAQDAAAARYAVCTAEARDLGVFGAPTYVIDGELFWGQDRLDFVARRLQAG
ncbi:MAG: 2-hydroxychromene-2-carboxylate isomerase [Pseudomonadota bacterium]